MRGRETFDIQRVGLDGARQILLSSCVVATHVTHERTETHKYLGVIWVDIERFSIAVLGIRVAFVKQLQDRTQNATPRRAAREW